MKNRAERNALVTQIKELHEAGQGKRSIARQLNCTYSMVVYHTNPKYREKAIEKALAHQKVARSQRPEVRQARKQDASDKLLAYFLEHPCVDCGNKDPRVLEFDHRNPEEKKFGVAYMVRNEFGWETIMKEIQKCDVRCSNCHRIRTHEQNSSHRLAWTPEYVQSLLD